MPEQPGNVALGVGIDFGTDMPLDQAALYEQPFEYVKANVLPTRARNRRAAYAERWWLHVKARSGMRKALAGLDRFIGGTLPDSALIVFARDDGLGGGISTTPIAGGMPGRGR